MSTTERTRTGLRPRVPGTRATADRDAAESALQLAAYDARLAALHDRHAPPPPVFRRPPLRRPPQKPGRSAHGPASSAVVRAVAAPITSGPPLAVPAPALPPIEHLFQLLRQRQLQLGGNVRGSSLTVALDPPPLPVDMPIPVVTSAAALIPSPAPSPPRLSIRASEVGKDGPPTLPAAVVPTLPVAVTPADPAPPIVSVAADAPPMTMAPGMLDKPTLTTRDAGVGDAPVSVRRTTRRRRDLPMPPQSLDQPMIGNMSTVAVQTTSRRRRRTIAPSRLMPGELLTVIGAGPPVLPPPLPPARVALLRVRADSGDAAADQSRMQLQVPKAVVDQARQQRRVRASFVLDYFGCRGAEMVWHLERAQHQVLTQIVHQSIAEVAAILDGTVDAIFRAEF